MRELEQGGKTASHAINHIHAPKPRHAMSLSDDRALRSEAMDVWREIAELGIPE